ncbi:tRNA-dihydrouridine(20) synthase [NAD(P)+]-like (Dihydrouridine synthase 2) (tRNA-dihydrouridine synthase 2-like) [Durusdinium trenchii]|uniref:tRNA-dihydrouridine(20) synthase [NAD(P)+]-like (Dihydrouridine synthase 2) (tRNA-dihydrouridine synthase 2-like) n=1 Tax=Durusdinium trenchii TaxID=1381693 RepID=A0ABP0PUT5_9DINO
MSPQGRKSRSFPPAPQRPRRAPLAVEAARLVCQDVSGIDVNMGCPKSFSVKGGMGAALLDKPEVVAEILTSLRRALPSEKSLTCKIRMLPSTDKTRDFMRICEKSGAEAITVHLRLRDERPAEPAHWDEMARVWDAVKVPVLANGDFFNRRQIDEFWKHCSEKECQVSGVMIARGSMRVSVLQVWGLWVFSFSRLNRGALWNPSIFSRDPPNFDDMVKSYVRSAVATNSTYQNTKWVLSQMLAGGTGVTVPTSFNGISMKVFNRELSATKSMAQICTAFGALDEMYPTRAHTTVFYKDFAFEDTKRPLETEVSEESAPKSRKIEPESGESA